MKQITTTQPQPTLTRRRFLTATSGLVGISALAACGLREQAAAPEATPADTITVVGTTTTGETPATAGAETYQVPGFLPYALAPAMLEVLAEQEDTVLVRHRYGETAIPRNPQRIYADGSTLDILLTLGVIPVGANSMYAQYADGPEPAPLLAPLLAQVPQYPRGPVNLEVVASHNPDVILVWEVVTFADDPDEMYTLLSNIAPTVVLNEDSYSFWQQATDDIAAMLGMSDRAAALRGEHEAVVEAQCTRIRNAIGEDRTITFIEVYPDAIWITPPGYTTETGFIPDGAVQWAYQDCRLLLGPEVLEIVGADGGGEQLSMEMLPRLQADHLVVFVNPDAEDSFEALVDRPLWQALPAVQAGNVYPSQYLLYTSYYGAVNALDIAATTIFDAE